MRNYIIGFVTGFLSLLLVIGINELMEIRRARVRILRITDMLESQEKNADELLQLFNERMKK